MLIDLKLFLSDLGLSEKESSLYVASLKYGPQTASTLALKTKLPRSTVNFVFGELIQKGFASKQTKSNSTYYTAIQPETIQYILEERKASTKKLESDFSHILPFLKGMQGTSSPIPKVKYFEGLEGLYRTIDDSCANDETVLFISSHNNMHPEIRDYIEKTYLKKSRDHTNKNQMIVNSGPEATKYLKKAKGVYSDVAQVDPKDKPFKLTTAIYGNKTLFLSYDPEDLSATIVENQLLAEHMRTVFHSLFREAKK
jgi:sugar-specific transcriptional regulator TrmB